MLLALTALAAEPTWTVSGDGWNKGLLLAPTGDLLAFYTGELRVLAREDGHTLVTVPTCAPASVDGVGWVESEIVVACNDRIVALAWPTLAATTVATFGRVDEATVGAGRVAVADKAAVRVYEGATVIAQFVPGGEVEGLAFSPDGAQLFAGVREIGTYVLDIKKESTIGPRVGRGRAPAWGPTLFANTGTFLAARFAPDTSVVSTTYKVGSWITASRWLDAETVVATGSDGLGWFRADGRVERASDRDLGEGLAVSGSTVCAAGRSGRVACFYAEPQPPSTFVAPKVVAPPAPAQATLVSRKGNVVVIDVPGGAKVGATAQLLKPFEVDLGFHMSGSLVIGELKVTSVRGDRVTFELIEEKGTVEINGKPVDHFLPGPVTVAW